MTTKVDLKARRVEAKITRKQAADAAGISQFKLDRIERGVDVEEEVRKAYDAGMNRLLAQAAKASTTNGKAETSTAKKTTARKAAQPKPKAEDPAA